MTKFILHILSIALVSITFLGCETIIHPKLESADPVLVVDAWLTNKSDTQTVILTKTQSYFDNTTPTGVSGALVTIEDNHGNTFAFTESNEKPGYYQWVPAADEVIGQVNDSFELTINVESEIFTASSHMGRVPAIDSITFDEDTQIGTNDKIYQGEFWATDPAGKGDTYWIKAYKNGMLLNKPSEINIAYDASFSAGGETDGVTFITPIRRGINPQDTDSNDKPLSPYAVGDSVNVQIFSITLPAFNYLNEVITQTDRPGGFQELFSTPLANVSTNIVNSKANGSKVVGFFNVSAVTSFGKRFIKP
ncbi:MAG TPA: DUF4249 domain-containing protein [Cyclobacteriaceae bacterium]|nr:DUF4249 domain-containing protein [Cyclobacteriaceae bacterium]